MGYQALSDRSDGQTVNPRCAALRQLTNRLVGVLHWLPQDWHE